MMPETRARHAAAAARMREQLSALRSAWAAAKSAATPPARIRVAVTKDAARAIINVEGERTRRIELPPAKMGGWLHRQLRMLPAWVDMRVRGHHPTADKVRRKAQGLTHLH